MPLSETKRELKYDKSLIHETRYLNPKNCEICGYRADCDSYWDYCPYDGIYIANSNKKGKD